ncbi:MAG: hypothetical protein ACK5AZ_03590 [Bryobacteraceae bacterium]
MEIDPKLAEQALQEAIEKYPGFAAYGPKIVWAPVYGGGTLLVRYEQPPPRDDPDAWEFQNAAVKGYKRLAGIS